MSRRSRDERQALADMRPPAVTPPERPSKLEATIDKSFVLSGLVHTDKGYCVVSAHYDATGKLLTHEFGTPQTWPQFPTKELVAEVRRHTNLLIEGR